MKQALVLLTILFMSCTGNENILAPTPIATEKGELVQSSEAMALVKARPQPTTPSEEPSEGTEEVDPLRSGPCDSERRSMTLTVVGTPDEPHWFNTQPYDVRIAGMLAPLPGHLDVKYLNTYVIRVPIITGTPNPKLRGNPVRFSEDVRLGAKCSAPKLVFAYLWNDCTTIPMVRTVQIPPEGFCP